MNLKEYSDEIKLIEKQNNVECDLYNLVYFVLKECSTFDKISIRNVATRRRTKSGNEKGFWGVKGFPDFVLLNLKYDSKIKSIDQTLMYGAVEMKAINKEMHEQEMDKLQLIGHLLWFNHVIYTNGIEWRFYSLQSVDKNKETPDMQKILDMQKKSYEIKGTKAKIKEQWDEIDESLKCLKFDEIEYKSFVLRTENEGEIVWDSSVWEKLKNYLNEYTTKMLKVAPQIEI